MHTLLQLITFAFIFPYTIAMSVQKVARESLAEVDKIGRFVRTESKFRNIISKENPVFKPQAGRYHLYISYACPWASRCLTVIKLKKLDSVIGLSVVHPTWQRTRPNDPTDFHTGWAFETGPLSTSTGKGKIEVPNCTVDPINNAKFIRDLYELSDDTHKKYSVPVLWDKETKTIVNNESSDIVRMFTKEFDEYASGPYATLDLYPESLRTQIDEVNDWVYPGINDGVYKCGFAQSQEAYDGAVHVLFDSLDRLEAHLSKSRYLVGNTFTEADIRLLHTLARFDEVYVVYFKCNVKRIIDYHNIRNYVRDIYQMDGVSESIHMDHIKAHYYTSHPVLNTYAVIPKGSNAAADFLLPHDRNRSY